MKNTDKVKILFCNIGWMRDYKGIQGDSIASGSAYIREHGTGFEVCNFLEIEGQVYGYVRTKNDIDLNNGAPIVLERITAREKEGESVSGVTVVWTAPRKNFGIVIVGWYNNATVYRKPKDIESPTELQEYNKISYCKIEASASDTRLLQPEERIFYINSNREKNFIGMSSIRYAYTKNLEVDPEDKNTISEAIQFMKFYNKRTVQVPNPEISEKEGKWRWAIHFYRERNSKVVKAKKEAVFKEYGKLCCEVCDFDFAATYGEWGKRYCEAHHTKQLSKIDGTVNTKPEDLAIVCSNCHRIIHLQDPMLTIEELKEKYKEIAKARGA